MLKSGVNIALIFADTTVALVVFRVISGGSTADGWREWTGGVLACAAAMAVDLIVLSVIIKWYDGRPPLSGLRSMASGVSLAAATAVIGLMPLLTLRLGALAAVPLIGSGAMLMVGYRAYASLADRHSSLERLFRFSRELSAAPESDDVLPSVLNQARELLRGERAEVVRYGEDGATVWTYDGTDVRALDRVSSRAAGAAARAMISGPDALLVRDDDVAGHHYLTLRGADEAVLAPLRYDGQTVGAIAVHDRLGEVRGFSASDVQLLQTIANHASVALHNEMLIGRLRHDALHDTLTGLPNRTQLTADANASLTEARISGGIVALMIIDLNGFKAVNDTLGHHVGDDLLRQVAVRFADASPLGVTVARLGGDEFAVLVRPSSPVPASTRRGAAARLADRAVRLRRGAPAPVRVGRDRARTRARPPRFGPAQARRHRDVRREERRQLLRAVPRRHRPARLVAAVADGRAARGDHCGPGRHRGRAGG